MMKSCLFSALLAAALAGNAKADFAVALECRHAAVVAPAPDSPDYRQYAPDREVDILHLALDVTPDFAKRTIAGKATLTFKPLGKPLRELKLDAVDLTILSVTASEKIQDHQATDKQLIVTFAQPIAVGKETALHISYQAEPVEGLYFRTPEMGYRDDETELWTQGEPEDSRQWYPNYDFPNEKFSSEVTCRVPEGMTVLSNGKLLSETKEASGLTAFHWKQEKPHVNYLIALVAGYFKKIEDTYRDLPLAFYVPPSEINEAQNTFRTTKDTLEFLEKEIGLLYPWEKYFQVVVRDFVAGGMENTSLTILTDRTLFADAFENIRSSENLVAHEAAHQWFGNMVTCKDWSQLWLNEGFATYYALLYDGHKNGSDSLRYGIWQTQKYLTGITNAPRPMVSFKHGNHAEQFGYLSYQKGSMILHMLRAQLGEELYRQCIKTFLERHPYDTVVTEDLNAVIEELSGRSFDRFFDQWVYHAHHPELDVDYSWDEQTQLAKISVKQTQKISDDIALFHFPLQVRFQGKNGVVDREFVVKEKEEDFYFALTEKPERVALDPDLELLAKINFQPPTAMLYAALAQQGAVAEKFFAIDQLSRKQDATSVAKLKHALNHDAFFGVRVEAAKALQTIHTDEALAALLDSTPQTDARVRRQVIASLGAFFSEKALAKMKSALSTEKNPDIIAATLRAMGLFPQAEVREILLSHLESKSYRNVQADAAINALRTQDNPVYIAPLQTALQKYEADFSTRGFSAGLAALAYLARHETTKDGVREFLLGYVNHPKKGLQLGAINALGTLEDPQAAAVLETFAASRKESPERAAAETALAAIRAARRPTDNLGEMRTELLELKKQQRETQKELDALKKKLNEKTPKAGKILKK